MGIHMMYVIFTERVSMWGPVMKVVVYDKDKPELGLLASIWLVFVSKSIMALKGMICLVAAIIHLLVEIAKEIYKVSVHEDKRKTF